MDTRIDRDPDPLRLYAIVREDLNMPTGKIASQAGHAYLDAYIDAKERRPEAVEEYDNHRVKVCLRAKNLAALERAYEEALAMGIPCGMILDAGYTCFDGKPTITALGIGPVRKSECASITKRFQLMD